MYTYTVSWNSYCNLYLIFIYLNSYMWPLDHQQTKQVRLTASSFICETSWELLLHLSSPSVLYAKRLRRPLLNTACRGAEVENSERDCCSPARGHVACQSHRMTGCRRGRKLLRHDTYQGLFESEEKLFVAPTSGSLMEWGPFTTALLCCCCGHVENCSQS